MQLPRVGNGTEAGTQAQDAVCCPSWDAWQAAGIQGLGCRWRTMRRMPSDGRKPRRGEVSGRLEEESFK